MLHLNLIDTVAFAGIILFVGYGLCRWIKPLSRYNIPAPVVGGLLVALAALIARHYGLTLFTFDTTLRDPLMIAFFTTIGFGASLRLLKVGGPQVLLFFIIATVAAIFQNVLGVGLAVLLGLKPLFGVLAGSVTLTGGPATGLAFAPLFEKAGVTGAATIAVAAAMFGIISGGLIGGPLGTFLIERHKLRKPSAKPRDISVPTTDDLVEAAALEPKGTSSSGEDDREAYILLKNTVVLLVAMWIGSWLSQGFAALHFTLPAYIGAMFVAAIIRNLDDLTGLIGLSQKTMDDLGHVALSLFLVIALMTLKLWELAGLVLPLVIVLLGQVILIIVLCLGPVFRLMGRDYESAVMSSGFCGFMMGTTANAMANMKVLVDKFGRAPRAFLVVPMVGAFFIDFTNALLITVFLNIFG
ncbi:MAG TPA: sodium/glutamate symporter [Candidatus Saccharicenans sp.]|nr:sodium/glutamate symporter [Candidatus Saccharicenans sp.]HPU93522.1 sodium/glutamate symporter [Candidatus Saccharicenans sp.]